VLASCSPEIVFGVVALLVVWALILGLLVSKRPDPRMILFNSLWARWPK